MSSVNNVFLIGNIGKDAVLRHTGGGTPVTTFSIATTERFKDRDGNAREDTTWHQIVLWGKVAEALTQYLVKGKQVCVQGKLTTRKWEKDGTKHQTTEVRAASVTLLGNARKPSDDVDADEPQRRTAGAVEPQAAPDDDDIPF